MLKFGSIMLEQHESHSAVLVGSSTHNERIERLWRDVWLFCLLIFFDKWKLRAF